MSSIQAHVSDSAPGVIGTSVSGSFTVLGFVANSLPLLQALSLIIGIAVGIVTFVYYFKKVRAEQVVATAKVAADGVKATAALAAEALKEMKADP